MSSRLQEMELFLKEIPNIEDYFWEECGEYWLTNEWLCGTFCGRAFVGETKSSVITQLIDYLDNHIGHNSVVGKTVTNSGWPNLNLVKKFITKEVE